MNLESFQTKSKANCAALSFIREQLNPIIIKMKLLVIYFFLLHFYCFFERNRTDRVITGKVKCLTSCRRGNEKNVIYIAVSGSVGASYPWLSFEIIEVLTICDFDSYRAGGIFKEAGVFYSLVIHFVEVTVTKLAVTVQTYSKQTTVTAACCASPPVHQTIFTGRNWEKALRTTKTKACISCLQV